MSSDSDINNHETAYVQAFNFLCVYVKIVAFRKLLFGRMKDEFYGKVWLCEEGTI
jgi:hypothetical protein